MTVYADSPSAAFSQSAALDQQRVQNYLQSIAANRNAQLQGWQAAQQIAAARQAQEQQQQAQMLQLAHMAAQQQAQQQNFGLSAQQIAETGRHNLADEAYRNAALGRENASLLAFRENQKQTNDALNEEAQHQTELARQLNARNALVAMKAKLDPTELAKALKTATGQGFDPSGDPAYSNKWFWHGEPKAKRTAEVMQGITSATRDVPANFGNASSIADYAEVAKKAIQAQIDRLPNPTSIKNLYSMVAIDDAGNFRPLRTLNPLLGGGGMRQPVPDVPTESPQAGGADPFARFNAWLQQQQ